MWWGILSLLVVLSLAVMIFRGPVAALGFGVLGSFLFPCWIVQPFGGVSIDLRVATSIVLLLLNLFHPRRRIAWSFTSGDWAVFTLYFVHVLSDTLQDGFAFSHFVRALGEWSVPYLAGRLAVQNSGDWRWLTGIAATVAIGFASMATYEAVTRVNVNDSAFGARPLDRTDPMAIRWGIKRAEGPTRHPIWLGMIQTLLLPWAVTASYRSLRGDAPLWWIVIPICSLSGIFATFSRGAIFAAFAVLFFTAVFFLPMVRRYLFFAAILLVGVGLVAKNHVFGSLEEMDKHKWGAARRERTVEFNGEEHRFTSMSHRWLVFAAYRPAIEQAGLLGFGTERTSTFPVNVPLGSDAEQTVARFWSIDCEYLLILLRFGWLGLAAFVAVCICSMIRIAKQSRWVATEERLLPFSVSATLIAVSLTFFVEWMPHDYGFLFLWLCGVANGPRLMRVDKKWAETRQIASVIRV